MECSEYKITLPIYTKYFSAIIAKGEPIQCMTNFIKNIFAMYHTYWQFNIQFISITSYFANATKTGFQYDKMNKIVRNNLIFHVGGKIYHE